MGNRDFHERRTCILSDDAYRIYMLTLGQSGDTDCDDARRAANLPPYAFDEAIGQLVSLGLLSKSSLDAGVLAPLPPDTARTQQLGPLVRELDRRQREVDELRAVYADLASAYQTSALSAKQGQAVEIVHDLAQVRSILTELAAQAQEDVITSQPGGARDEKVLSESRQRTDDLLRRGVQMRTIYQHTARYSPATVSYVEHITRLGAQVRTRSDGFMRLIVFDGEIAVTELKDDKHGAVIVRDSHVVHFMYRAFERAWNRATEFQPKYDSSVVEQTSEEVKVVIMNLLVDGVEDKVIARRLGMSLRTCQRHISEIMRRLGAKNRLHAGYLIHQLGLVRRAAPSVSIFRSEVAGHNPDHGS